MTGATFASIGGAACVGDTATVGPGVDGGNDGATVGDVVGADVGDAGASDGNVGAKYSSLSDSTKWKAYAPAGSVSGSGVVFDGTYVYFIEGGAGVFRYDPTKAFDDPSAYSKYLISTLVSGGVAVGKSILFFPTYQPSSPHTFVRYDATQGFTAAAAWTTYQAPYPGTGGLAPYYATGGAFDGKFVYAASTTCGLNITCGLLTRFDTTALFNDKGSWTGFDMGTLAANSNGAFNESAGAGFDGRYLYMPHYKFITRYDTKSADLTQSSGYTAFDATQVDSSYTKSLGAVFDGQYMYFPPESNSSSNLFLRYDHAKAFDLAGSWEAFAAPVPLGGYSGTQFDGRYVYFAPAYGPSISPSSVVVRFDSTKSFIDKASWESFDLKANVATDASGGPAGFSGAAFDGRYVYMITGSGLFVRFDAKTPPSVPTPTASFY